jgi:hypothetical protein
MFTSRGGGLGAGPVEQGRGGRGCRGLIEPGPYRLSRKTLDLRKNVVCFTSEIGGGGGIYK